MLCETTSLHLIFQDEPSSTDFVQQHAMIYVAAIVIPEVLGYVSISQSSIFERDGSSRPESRLNPGGRLVLGTFATSRQQIQNTAWLSSVLPGFMTPEALYVPNESPRVVREPIWVRYDLNDHRYWTEGWQAIVTMRSATKGDGKLQVSAFPEFPFDDFIRQYDNPWLMRAMISVQSRMMSARRLGELADEVIVQSNRNSDIAAAFCVKAYLILGQHGPWLTVNALIDSFAPRMVVDSQSTDVDIRWAVSLLYVKALLEQKYGHRDKARRTFEECARSPFLRFAPMLATKTISACQQIALTALADEDRDGAVEWFTRGVEQSLAAIHDLLRFVPPFPLYVLPEISQVIGLGAQCNGALIALRQKGISPMIWDLMKCDISSQVQGERLTSWALRQQLQLVVKSKTQVADA